MFGYILQLRLYYTWKSSVQGTKSFVVRLSAICVASRWFIQVRPQKQGIPRLQLHEDLLAFKIYMGICMYFYLYVRNVVRIVDFSCVSHPKLNAWTTVWTIVCS